MRHLLGRVIPVALAAGLLAAQGTGVDAARAVAAAPAVDVQRVPHGGIQPEVATGRDGVIHLVYFTGTPGAGDLFYVSSADGGRTFSGPLRVNSQPGSAIATGTIRGAQVAAGPDGRVHVAWNGSDAALPRGVANPKTRRAGSPMLYARSNAQRTAFEPQRNLMTHTFDLDGGGSLAVDEGGAVYVAWHANDVTGDPGEASRRVWLARSTDGGATLRAGSCGVVRADRRVRLLRHAAVCGGPGPAAPALSLGDAADQPGRLRAALDRSRPDVHRRASARVGYQRLSHDEHVVGRLGQARAGRVGDRRSGVFQGPHRFPGGRAAGAGRRFSGGAPQASAPRLRRRTAAC